MARRFWLCLVILLLCGCGARVERFSGATMGSHYSVHYVPVAGGPSLARVKGEVQDILAELDRQFSNWRDDSSVARFNALPAGACQTLPVDMRVLLEYGRTLAEASGGAFDLTVEPLMNLWGFGPQPRREKVPTAAMLQRERARVGYRHVWIDGPQVCKDVAAQLDFDSLVAGYAVDRVSQRLAQLGLVSYRVEVAGELKAVGRKSDGTAWQVALEVPDVALPRRVERVLVLDGLGASTSGDYRHYFEEGGQRYSHTFDARSGAPVRHRLAAVTVVDPSALHADGLSTLLMVLGPEEGLAFAEREGVAARFVVHQDNGFNSFTSRRFEALFPMGSPEPRLDQALGEKPAGLPTKR